MKPNQHYDHVFVIVRADLFHGPETPIEERIIVTKILRDGEQARREVERLNGLRNGGRVHYFSQVARLERQLEESAPLSQDERHPEPVPVSEHQHFRATFDIVLAGGRTTAVNSADFPFGYVVKSAGSIALSAEA